MGQVIPLRPRKHRKQIRAFNDLTRNQFWLAGRRGGKTAGIKEKAAKLMASCPRGGEVYYIGPTNKQALEIIWEPLEDTFDELGFKFQPRISKQRFEFSQRRKLYVIGAEKIRRIRGHKVWHAFMDELAFFETPLQKVLEAVRPTLTDLCGGITAATTPNGKGTEAYQFALAAQRNPQWAFHHWYTLDNPGIMESEIEAAKNDLDEKSWRQEYMATWEAFEGLAYYNFDENVHLEKCSDFHWDGEQIETGIQLDFNVNPTSLLVHQMMPDEKYGDHLFQRKEYSLKNSSTIETMKQFCEDFKEHKEHMGPLYVYGDASGKNRSSGTGRSDYFYVEEVLDEYGFEYEKRVKSKNISIVDRVAYTNGRLKNYHGDKRSTIDPECRDLVLDLGSQALEGRHPSPKNNLGHKADAMGYLCSWKHLNSLRTPTRTIQL